MDLSPAPASDEAFVAVRWMAEPDGAGDGQESVYENVTAFTDAAKGGKVNAETSQFFGENPFMGIRHAPGATRETYGSLGDDGGLYLSEYWNVHASAGAVQVQVMRVFVPQADGAMALTIARDTRRENQTLRFVRPAVRAEHERVERLTARAAGATAGGKRAEGVSTGVSQSRMPRASRAAAPRRSLAVAPAAAAGTITSFSIALDDDWAFDSGLPDKIALLTLQAWANAPPEVAGAKANAEPALYFTYPDDWDFTYTGVLHDHYANAKGYALTPLGQDFGAALKAVPHAAESYVVWDPKVHDSINVALTAAGVHRAIAVTEAHIADAKAMGLRLAADLRGKYDGMSTLEVQQSAWGEYGARTNRSLAVMNGGPCCSGPVAMPAVADWGVSRNAFFMSLSTRPENADEYALAKEILSGQNNFTLLMGWHKYGVDLERTFTSLASSQTLRVEGLHSVPNLSFSNRVRLEPGFEYRNNHNVKPGQVVTPEANKTYIALVQTDSIGLGAWTKPGRGQLPYAWETPVNYVWLAPAVLEYFYNEATPNDYFIGAISGPGYMYPGAVPFDALPHVVELSAGLMKQLDMRVWETMDDSHGSTVVGTSDLTQRVAETYLNNMPDLLGMVHGYAPAFTFASGGRDGRTPLLSFDYYLDPAPPPEQAAADLQELRAINLRAGAAPYYCLVHVREWSNITRVEQVLDGLDSDFFEVVPLDTFLAMARAKPTFETHFAPPYNSTQE